jgi:hypothetical protein
VIQSKRRRRLRPASQRRSGAIYYTGAMTFIESVTAPHSLQCRDDHLHLVSTLAPATSCHGRVVIIARKQAGDG